jgi:hypothetical protein
MMFTSSSCTKISYIFLKTELCWIAEEILIRRKKLKGIQVTRCSDVNRTGEIWHCITEGSKRRWSEETILDLTSKL